MRNPEAWNVGTYLIKRLEDAGVKHLFGVPGDYVLDFLNQVAHSSICWIGNCNELNAGYAADGYARMAGLGAAVVTYGVGGFSILNAIAGAYAEQVPVVLVSGAPPLARRQANAMVHHLTRDYLLQFEIYQKVTVDSAMLTNPQTAPQQIDRVLTHCLTQKRPVYLEMPQGIGHAVCQPPEALESHREGQSDPKALNECIEEAATLINKAQNPVVLVGVEVVRFGLTREVLKLIEQVELPFATTLCSKSALPELHPQFMGIYQGALSHESVRKQVEGSDCVLSLGVWMTDFETGCYSFQIDDSALISCTTEQVRIGHHSYLQVALSDFIAGLTGKLVQRSFLTSHSSTPLMPRAEFRPQTDAKLTVRRFFEGLNSFLDDDMILMVEPGEAFCTAPYLQVEEPENFIVQAYYCSIGYCVPAALGVSLARPGKRPVVLAGDGAFQMTAQEISSLIRFHCNAIIFVLNNGGYMIERKLHEDGLYNDLQGWRFHDLPAIFGENSIALNVKTEGDLEKALRTARNETQKLIFIELNLPSVECSPALQALSDRLNPVKHKTSPQ